MVVNSKKMIRSMKIMLAVLITVVVVFAGAAALYLKSIKDDPSKMFGGNANFSVTDEAGNKHQYNQGTIAFAIVGLDSSGEREDANMGYRSDVMMVCVVDTDNNQASIISIPRDTKARVQVLNSEGKPTRMVTTKMNAAFSYGFSPDKYGYENTLAAINELFKSSGVNISPITTYIGADMDDFVMAANLIGGVELQLPQDVPGFGSQGEWVHLNGDRALDYVRIRSGGRLSGMDTDRTDRQRGYIKAVASRIQQLGSLATVPKIYNECVKEGYIKTNLTVEQMYAISSSLENIKMDEVMFTMLPGYVNDNEGPGYWHVNKTQLKAMILDVFYNSDTGYVPTPHATNLPSNDTPGTKTEYTYSRKTKTSSGTTRDKTSSKKTTQSSSSSSKKPQTDATSTSKATQSTTKSTTEKPTPDDD